MGWSIKAYYPADQKEIEQFIKDKNINIEDWEQCNIVSKYFYEKITGIKCEYKISPLSYLYNKKLQIHDLIEFHGCNYIRDHKLLNCDHPSIPDLPIHISLCLTCLRTPEDAIRIATDLRKIFSNDEDLMYFAEWLETTSKYCYAYRLDD